MSLVSDRLVRGIAEGQQARSMHPSHSRGEGDGGGGTTSSNDGEVATHGLKLKVFN